MKKWIPALVAAVMAAWVLAQFRPRPEPGFRLREFAQLPVLMNGRFQPFDSVARNSLLQIRTKQTVPVQHDGARHTFSAIEWLLEVMMQPEAADERPIFRVDNVELLSLLQLPEGRKYYTFAELRPSYDEINRQALRIEKIESAQRTAFERALMKLFNAVSLYQRLKVTLKPPASDDFAAEIAEYERVIPGGVAAVRARQAGKEFDETVFNRLLELMSGYDAMARFALPLVIPPAHGRAGDHDWQTLGAALMGAVHQTEWPPAIKWYARMVSGWRANKPEVFNSALAEYQQWLGEHYPRQVFKVQWEYRFNVFQPFYRALVIYILALVLALISLLTFALLPGFAETLRRSAFWLVALAVGIHTIGLIFRMALEGRPPVTNLYSSAVFIGWAAALLGLLLERFYRVGIGLIVASVVGFTTLVIAHHLSLGGDTMEMLRAVLDTNFWLATHVVTITLGYSAMFVAGLLAILFIILGVFTPLLNQPLGAVASPAGSANADPNRPSIGSVFTNMVYGIICFATLFSFTGTVLGGIWADQSWGRFWGWDPKENGALLIVIWCALILHARWAGLVRERGLMNLAIFGNVVTSFSWFGVNMLGIGLHSYGFMDAAFKWLVLFVASQLAFIALGLLPLRYWRSFQNAPQTAASADQPMATRPAEP
ncbi:MAG: cytochrome c biogenesis protein CcsA [Verrucomicrobiae bacterium]|nr:cytochrome c biogenesis protein CcsA [Verrucomicrobiae bacterium]MDW8309006.1 cytochrome c biogenesis protein CcsA [Verrucomicrobiales bacterium]